jgi:LemA protein
MKRSLALGVALVAIVLVAVGGCLTQNYNRLVSGREAVGQRWAQVDNQLLRRSDLVFNLVETVRGVARQELAVFGEIAEARARMAGAGARSPAAGVEAGRAMDSALARLLAVVESYPQLRSSELFLDLMTQIEGAENRLATERMRYNQQVQDYNLLVKRFPGSLYARGFGFDDAPYYQIPDTARAAPRVDFGGVGRR